MTAPTSFDEHFCILTGPRVERTKLHPLRNIVTIALCGVLGGAESWTEIEQFGLAKQAWFAQFLDLSNGIPSHDTFGRVFAALDPQQFEAGCVSWVQAALARPGHRPGGSATGQCLCPDQSCGARAGQG